MAMRRDFGSIVKRKGSRNYYVRFPVRPWQRGESIERVAGPTKELAKDVLRRVHHLLVSGRTVDEVLHEVFGDPLPGRMTFREAAPKYIEYAKGAKKRSTWYGYEKVLNLLCRERWTAKQLGEITRADVAGWKDAQIALGNSPQTVNNKLSACSAVFTWAIERCYAEVNPVRQVKRLKVPKGRETYLTASEARALVRAAPERFRMFLTMALNTGMRRGELLGLTWRCIDLDEGKILIEDPKNSRNRRIRMNSLLCDEMRRYAESAGKRRRKATDQVFAEPSGARYTESKQRIDLQRAVAACDEIPEHKKPTITMHVMRHTAASLMVASGIPLYDAAQILGHENIQITMRYAHFQAKAGKAAVEALGRALTPRSTDGADRVEERLAELGIGSANGQWDGHTPQQGRSRGRSAPGRTAPKAQKMDGGRAKESNLPATRCRAAQRF